MDTELISFLGMLVKFGSPPSLIIAAAWAFLERKDRLLAEKQHREDRERDRERLELVAKESIQAIQNSNFTASTLTSLLGGFRGRSRG